jgi:hypothetical protein
MNYLRSVICFLVTVAAALNVTGAEQPSLDPHLELLRPWLGKTWKGEFKNSTPEKPTIDIARWERALNGKAVRVLHSINAGAYGGESIITWDEATHTIMYHYFTTAGFNTKGTITIKDGKIMTHEVVNGGAGGVTEVRGETEMHKDGTFLVKTEHLKNGEWTFGRETKYREDPTAVVAFK